MSKSSADRPNTYMVHKRSKREELERLAIQDRMITTGMGGVLPEQTDLSHLRRVLDVGCGSGDWLFETARSIPTISLLIGVDISSKVVEYMRAQAIANQMADRVEYYVMDVLQTLEFPPAHFDLVNQRLALSYLRTWDWCKLLGEYQRVTQPGGIIRITESNVPESNSVALTCLNDLFLDALSQAGHMFIPDNRSGVIDELEPLLKRNGFRNVQTRLHTLEYRANTPEGQYFIEDETHLFHILLPFFRKWCHVPEDYKDIYQEALHDMQQPNFVATWKLLTAWGTNPS